MSDERGERKVDALRDYSDTDWKNAWGRVTHLLDVPWEASAGKVCEEIRKLQSKVDECHKLSRSAAMECGGDFEAMFQRMARIEGVCRD